MATATRTAAAPGFRHSDANRPAGAAPGPSDTASAGGAVRSGIAGATAGGAARAGGVVSGNDSERADARAGPGPASLLPKQHPAGQGRATGLEAAAVGACAAGAAVARFGAGTTAGGLAAIQLAAAPVPCFVAGTLIDTDEGPLPVETLRPGDRVSTARGAIRSVEWIGFRHVNCRRHPDPACVCPVRIVRHAFGNGRPTRALLLSPDHAVFVDDVLVPVRLLVNGTTIAPRRVAKVDYYHVGLRRHDILLAEGLPVESCPDAGGRTPFADGGYVMRLYPDAAPDPDQAAALPGARGCAPLVLSDKRIEPIRAMLRARAQALRGDRGRPRT